MEQESANVHLNAFFHDAKLQSRCEQPYRLVNILAVDFERFGLNHHWHFPGQSPKRLTKNLVIDYLRLRLSSSRASHVRPGDRDVNVLHSVVFPESGSVDEAKRCHLRRSGIKLSGQ